MKVYKVTLLVIDLEDIGENFIREELGNCRYIYPSIQDVQSVDIGPWRDDHPLNQRDTCDAEFKRLFP